MGTDGRDRVHFWRLVVVGVARKRAEVARLLPARAAHEAYGAVSSVVLSKRD